ncbi:hypothetical protein SNEBB_006761 [Seison nebaliae]|nr:hypothetical protein SNEBB_006761 [Seison nebaliae]
MNAGNRRNDRNDQMFDDLTSIGLFVQLAVLVFTFIAFFVFSRPSPELLNQYPFQPFNDTTSTILEDFSRNYWATMVKFPVDLSMEHLKGFSSFIIVLLGPLALLMIIEILLYHEKQRELYNFQKRGELKFLSESPDLVATEIRVKTNNSQMILARKRHSINMETKNFPRHLMELYERISSNVFLVSNSFGSIQRHFILVNSFDTISSLLLRHLRVFANRTFGQTAHRILSVFGDTSIRRINIPPNSFDWFTRTKPSNSITFGNYESNWHERTVAASAILKHMTGSNNSIGIFWWKCGKNIFKMIDEANENKYSTDDLFLRLAVYTQLNVEFGTNIEYESRKYEEFYSHTKEFNEEFEQLLHLENNYARLFLTSNDKFQSLKVDLQKMLLVEIRTTMINSLDTNQADSGDIMPFNIMKQIQPTVTTEELALILVELYIIGVRKIASSLQWLFYYMGKEVDLQETLRTHVRTRLEPFEQDYENIFIEPKHKHQLPLLVATVYESFRLSNLLPIGYPHSASRNIKIFNEYVGKASPFLFHYQSINLDNDIFPNPENFDIYRFLEKDLGFNYEKISMVASFGFGVRRCPAKQFSIDLIFSFLANILKQFNSITLNESDEQSRYTAYLKKPPLFKIKFIS